MEEFLDIDNRNAWGTLFQEIRNESNTYTYVTKDAKKVENKNLNRYRDVNPFDHSRVRLQRSESDYINASLVNVPSAERSYILTQGPLLITTGHFWLMVWEQKSKAILMLNRVVEKNTVKCHQYWPVGFVNGGADNMLLTDVELKITYLSETTESNYIVRKFLITDLQNDESREILQFHYIAWPDFSVPQSPSDFLDFLFSVRDSGALTNSVGPAVVHCSAGIGRSGTFCLVDSCLVLIEKYKDINSISIRQQLLEMRHYRMGLIQTPDQLRFSYVAVIEGAKRILNINFSTIVPSENDKIKDPKQPTTSTNCNHSVPQNNSLTELRKRNRKERDEKTATIVQNIKKKQKEAELWEKRRSFIKISIGLVLIIGLGYFVYKNYSKS